MTSPAYGMDAMGHPLKGDEGHHMLSYPDMTAQARHPTLQYPHASVSSFPYSHFALMYVDRNGELQLEASPSIVGYEKSIFTQDVQERFMKTATTGWQPNLSGFASNSNSHIDGDVKQPFIFGLQQNTPNWYQPPQGLTRPAGLIPCEFQSLQNKRRRNVGGGIERASDSTSPTPSIRMTALRVGDQELMRTYYEKAFENFQQLNCRAIAKAFVKLVEPRKQVHHPYNGRKTSAGGSSQRVDPELTKPKWWPTGVTHKEPDHLLKSDRIRLLVHILCELRESHGITAEKLKDAGQDVRRQIMPAERIQVLDEIYYVRDMEELYLEGKISPDTIIHVSHVHLTDTNALPASSSSSSSSATPEESDSALDPTLPTISVKEGTPSMTDTQQPGSESTNPDAYLPLSPVSSPAISRKSSLESSLNTSYSAADLTSSMLTSGEPAPKGGVFAARDVQVQPPPPGPTCLPDFFAQHHHHTGHNTQAGFWDSLHPAHASLSFHGY